MTLFNVSWKQGTPGTYRECHGGFMVDERTLIDHDGTIFDGRYADIIEAAIECAITPPAPYDANAGSYTDYISEGIDRTHNCRNPSYIAMTALIKANNAVFNNAPIDSEPFLKSPLSKIEGWAFQYLAKVARVQLQELRKMTLADAIRAAYDARYAAAYGDPAASTEAPLPAAEAANESGRLITLKQAAIRFCRMEDSTATEEENRKRADSLKDKWRKSATLPPATRQDGAGRKTKRWNPVTLARWICENEGLDYSQNKILSALTGG